MKRENWKKMTRRGLMIILVLSVLTMGVFAANAGETEYTIEAGQVLTSLDSGYIMVSCDDSVPADSNDRRETDDDYYLYGDWDDEDGNTVFRVAVVDQGTTSLDYNTCSDTSFSEDLADWASFYTDRGYVVLDYYKTDNGYVTFVFMELVDGDGSYVETYIAAHNGVYVSFKVICYDGPLTDHAHQLLNELQSNVRLMDVSAATEPPVVSEAPVVVSEEPILEDQPTEDTGELITPVDPDLNEELDGIEPATGDSERPAASEDPDEDEDEDRERDRDTSGSDGGILLKLIIVGIVAMVVVIIVASVLLLTKSKKNKKRANTAVRPPVFTPSGTPPVNTPPVSTPPVSTPPVSNMRINMPTGSATRFCPGCGAELRPGATFCGKCGRKI